VYNNVGANVFGVQGRIEVGGCPSILDN